MWAQAPVTSGFLMGSTPQPVVNWAKGKNGVATWFRFKNQIRHFGPLTYLHRFAYQIMGPEFGYDLGRCQATKTVRLVGWPPLYIARLYLVKEFIKKAIILNLNMHHALKWNNIHNMLKIKSQHIRKQIKQIILNMENWQLNKTHKEKISDKTNMARLTK